MDRTEQKKTEEMPVVSPLARDKTYGERWYDRIFDNFLNYWTNLLASAGFSHWAANSDQKLSILGNAKPREIQNRLGNWISSQWFMEGYKKGQLLEHGAGQAAEGLANGSISQLRASRLLKKASIIAERNLGKRGFAMAESLTLLVPGFVVMIPSVWLGAKIKPWFVEKLNKRHYGEEAMDDPSLKARHQAIEAEVRPTLLGTIFARLGTVGAVQLSAKFIGSESNTLNWIGKGTNNDTLKKFKGINPVAESIGGNIGNSMPQEFQEYMNTKAQKIGFSWSDKQIEQWQKKNPSWQKQHPKKTLQQAMGSYNKATQDIAKFIAMDTIYTLVSAGTIRPFLKLLRHVPGMSYKPKVAANSATFDGENIKVPPNRYADVATDVLARADASNEPQFDAAADKPDTKVSTVRERETIAANDPHHKVPVHA